MANFVLVHPAWMGGWCWKKLVPLLGARGHAVFTPTLTGMGERSHLARPEIGLSTHVEDVVRVLEYEDLSDVILVANSSGGMVITGVADRVPERLSHVTYLDAFVPQDGECMLDLVPPERRPTMIALVASEGEGWMLPRFGPASWAETVTKHWGVTDEADVQWMLARLGPTPFGHFKDAVRRRNPAAEKLARSYIRCGQWFNPNFDRFAAAAKCTPGWRAYDLALPHIPYVTHPRELADVLLEAVR